MPNAREANLTDHTSVCLIGPVGSGKTSQYRTLPGRGFIYIFASNSLPSLKGMDVEYELFAPDLLDINVKPLKSSRGADKYMTPPEPLAYASFEEHLELFLENKHSGPYQGIDDFDWIGLDELTAFSESVMDRVLYLNDRMGKHPEQADWTAQMSTVSNVCRSLAHRRKLFVACAHDELRQEEETGKTFFQPVLTGRLRTRLPGLFTEIFRTETDRNGDEVERWLVTVSDKKHQYIRTSIDGLPTEVEVTIKPGYETECGLGKILQDAGRLDFEKKSGRQQAPVVQLKGKRR